MKTITIEELIAELNELQSKGHTTLQFEGTLMCESDSNSIIFTTQPQI